MEKLKHFKYKQDFKQEIVVAVIEIIIGILLFVLKIENLIPIMAVIIGVIFLLNGLFKLLFIDGINNIYIINMF